MFLPLLLLLATTTSPPPQTDLRLRAEQGKQAMAEGRFADAAAIYSEIVRVLPDDGGMRLNLGMALSMAGRLREAMPHLERAVALQPALAPAWLFLGSNRLELGDYAGAAAALRRVTAAEPRNVRAHELLGRALLQANEFEPAARAFRAVIEADGRSAAGWYGLGRSYEALARHHFSALESNDPQSAYALALRADALAAGRQLERARALYQQALSARPDFAPARRALARLDGAAQPAAAAPCEPLECEFVAGNHAAVVRAAAGRATPAARYWLTLAYNELARAAFATLAALPPSPELHQFRAEIHANQGRPLDAVQELRHALARRPDDAELAKQLGAALYRAKQYAEAADVLERVAKQDGSPEVLFLLGDTLLTLGRSAEAVKPLERVVALAPEELAARASLGRAYLQQGNAEAAIPHLEAALPADEDGSLHYQLARAYQRVGKSDLAKQTLEKSARLRKP